jgi:CubicO group peptidase (beta-lactamase class C family)
MMRRALATLFLLLVLPAFATSAPPPPAPPPASPLRESAQLPEPAIDRLAAYLEGLETLGFSGAIVVEHRGRVALRRGFGLADRDTRRPYTPETVQTHGSITKQITAAAILLLESRGKLSVEDPIGKHLGPVPADKEGVTLHHLLTHSAGFPGSIGRDAEPIDAEAFLERALATPLAFAPGTAYDYSNVGYSLLGIVIERVGGRSYEAFVREELLLPAGLSDTGYLLPGWRDERLAEGYLAGAHWGRVHRRQWRDDGPGWNLRANGGLHTTVDDMHRWLDVLRGRGPLPPAAVAKWTAPYVAEGGGDLHYAYGWAVGETELGRIVTHNGGNGIFSADFLWLPDAELFLYLQGNTSSIEASQLQDSLLAALFDPAFVPPPAIPPDPAADPARTAARAGVYASEGGTLTLAADDVRLVATVAGQPLLDALLAHGPEVRQRLAELDARARTVVERLAAGRDDALTGLVAADDDAAERARRLLAVVARGGELRALTIVGSVANAPGSRFGDEAPWTTFVRADFGDLLQAWSLLWRADGTYRATAIGPLSDLPGFVLVPTGKDRYAAIERVPPWRRMDLQLDGDCLAGAGIRACR